MCGLNFITNLRCVGKFSSWFFIKCKNLTFKIVIKLDINVMSLIFENFISFFSFLFLFSGEDWKKILDTLLTSSIIYHLCTFVALHEVEITWSAFGDTLKYLKCFICLRYKNKVWLYSRACHDNNFKLILYCCISNSQNVSEHLMNIKTIFVLITRL